MVPAMPGVPGLIPGVLPSIPGIPIPGPWYDWW